MHRRKLLKAVPAVIAGSWIGRKLGMAPETAIAVTVSEPPPKPPKEWIFNYWEENSERAKVEARTLAMKPAQAKQFIDDACRDMEVIMRRGKIYPPRETKWLLTRDE